MQWDVYKARGPSIAHWNLELSLDCKVQLIIFVRGSAKRSELFLPPQLSCDVTLDWLLHDAVSFTSHSSWLSCLTTQNNFGVHVAGSGEHMAKRKKLSAFMLQFLDFQGRGGKGGEREGGEAESNSSTCSLPWYQSQYCSPTCSLATSP